MSIETLPMLAVTDQDTTEQAYLQRILITISEMGEEEWDQLPEDLQEWYNQSMQQMPEGQEEPIALVTPDILKEFTANFTTEAPAPVAKKRGRKPKAESEQKEPKEKKAKEPKEPKAPKEKKAKEPKEPKAPKAPRGPVAAQAVREILCGNMALTIDEVLALMTEQGIRMERSSCQVVHLNTVRAFEMIMRVGHVKKANGDVVVTRVDD